MSSDAYANVNIGKLKLKGAPAPVVGEKRRKKKRKVMRAFVATPSFFFVVVGFFLE